MFRVFKVFRMFRVLGVFWAFRVQGVCALGCSEFRDNSLELR